MSNLCFNAFNNFYLQEFNKMISDAKLKSSKNLMLIYKKVSLSIKKYPFPILTSSQASSLEGVGETIRKLFDNLIKQHKETLKHEGSAYIQLAYKLNHPAKDAKSKKTKASKSSQEAQGSALRVAKIKNLVNIPVYSSLWTSVISAYLLFYQTDSITVSVEDVFSMAKTLSEQFGSVGLTIEKCVMEDFKQMKLLDIVDSFERDKKIKVNDYLIKLAQVELKKIGVEVMKDEEGELDFTMSEVNTLSNCTQLIQKSNIKQTSIVETINLFPHESQSQGSINNHNSFGKDQVGLQWNEDRPKSAIAAKFRSFITQIKEDYSDHCANITMIIDNREKGSNNENFKEEILNLTTSSLINIDERNLSLGDFLWTYTDPSDSIEYVIDFIIERKALNDLASSIIDGRYTEQKYRLKNSGFTNVSYLFEGTNYSNEKCISRSALNTAINNTMTIHGINAVRTDSTKDTVRYLLLVDDYIKRTRSVLCDKDKNRVSFEDYTRLNAKTKHASVESVFVQQLRTFNNCGSRSVELIRNVFKSPLCLYRVIRRCVKENVPKEEMINLINIANYLYEKGDKEEGVSEDEIMKYFRKENFSKIKKGLKSVKKLRKDTVASIVNFYLGVKDEDGDEEDEGEGKDEANKENINDMKIDWNDFN